MLIVEFAPVPSSGLRPPSPIRWEKEIILWDVFPGWRPLRFLTLGYYLSPLQGCHLVSQ